ncbi:LysR family transcriptional regulator [Vibrio tubiashii]|uniref:LysR family transcriptional regulator n=1 Tax=Vibrio tubiashii TaxID=29498 RepID=UPI00234F5717|nr:LysR family transcriptional regulator [Vibrio tubiashii]WCP67757.1 LysR family transcriptional regulator [Vibrio tubiashii]
MAKDLFYNLDLNLLRTFLVLSQELNMRKASQRLFVSQPAISQALQKLRHHFDDDLFVKVPKGLEPTSFAIELAESITPHLDGLANALNASQEFDPSEVNSKLKIALAPMVLTCLSGTLFQQLKSQAPNAEIELVSWTRTTLEDISKGQVLIGVNYELPKPKEVYINHLIDVNGLVLVRKDHPITKTVAEPQDFEGYEIASFIVPGWNEQASLAEKILKSQGVTAKTGFRSEMIMAVIDVIQHTDMFMPHSNLFPIEQYPSLRAIEVNVDHELKTASVYSHYHIKNRNNPLIRWLHKEIQTALEKQVLGH